MGPRMSKTPFSEKLQQLMAERDLTESDLAKRIWGTMKDEKGNTVAVNRQALNKYLRGTVVPRRTTLRKIAKALGVPDASLIFQNDPLDRVGSGLLVSRIDNRNSRLEVSLVVPSDVAADVVQQLAPYSKI